MHNHRMIYLGSIQTIEDINLIIFSQIDKDNCEAFCKRELGLDADNISRILDSIKDLLSEYIHLNYNKIWKEAQVYFNGSLVQVFIDDYYAPICKFTIKEIKNRLNGRNNTETKSNQNKYNEDTIMEIDTLEKESLYTNTTNYEKISSSISNIAGCCADVTSILLKYLENNHIDTSARRLKFEWKDDNKIAVYQYIGFFDNYINIMDINLDDIADWYKDNICYNQMNDHEKDNIIDKYDWSDIKSGTSVWVIDELDGINEYYFKEKWEDWGICCTIPNAKYIKKLFLLKDNFDSTWFFDKKKAREMYNKMKTDSNIEQTQNIPQYRNNDEVVLLHDKLCIYVGEVLYLVNGYTKEIKKIRVSSIESYAIDNIIKNFLFYIENNKEIGIPTDLKYIFIFKNKEDVENLIKEKKISFLKAKDKESFMKS